MHTGTQLGSSSLKRRVIKAVFRVILSLPAMLTLYAISLIGAACLFAAVEEGVDFWEAFYWADITSLSIGYGDISPKTWEGRHLIAFFFTKFWLLIVIPTIAAHVLVRVLKNAHIFTHREQEWLLEVVQMIAEKLGITTPPMPSDTDYDPELMQQ